MSLEHHFSAGGVVYDNIQGQIYVVLCGRDSPTQWCLPKGTPEPGESPANTATREVAEETGLNIEIEQEIGEIEYWFNRHNSKIHKTVRFYLMRFIGGTTSNHDLEFDRVEWFPFEDATSLLTYVDEVGILEKAIRQLKKRTF